MPQRNRTTITKTIVDRLSAGQSVWDDKVRGFGVRCQINDKSFVLNCWNNGRQRFLTIGKFGSPWTVDAARKQALALLTDIQKGVDPIKKRTDTRSHVTMSQLCGRYLAEHAIPHKKPSSAYADRSNIENHVVPLLGNKFVDSVSKADIEQFRNAVLVGKTAPTDPKAKQLESAWRAARPRRSRSGKSLSYALVEDV